MKRLCKIGQGQFKVIIYTNYDTGLTILLHTGLSPQQFYIFDSYKAIFCCGPMSFMFWSRISVLFEPHVHFHILLKFG